VTTWLRRRMSLATWQLFHRLSYLGFVALFLHAILSGTDLTSPLIAALTWLAAAVVAYYSFERVRRSRPMPSAG